MSRRNRRAALPGGRRYDVEYCFVFELRDGLISRVREYLDTRRGLEMFGPVSGWTNGTLGR